MNSGTSSDNSGDDNSASAPPLDRRNHGLLRDLRPDPRLVYVNHLIRRGVRESDAWRIIRQGTDYPSIRRRLDLYRIEQYREEREEYEKTMKAVRDITNEGYNEALELKLALQRLPAWRDEVANDVWKTLSEGPWDQERVKIARRTAKRERLPKQIITHLSRIKSLVNHKFNHDCSMTYDMTERFRDEEERRTKMADDVSRVDDKISPNWTFERTPGEADGAIQNGLAELQQTRIVFERGISRVHQRYVAFPEDDTKKMVEELLRNDPNDEHQQYRLRVAADMAGPDEGRTRWQGSILRDLAVIQDLLQSVTLREKSMKLPYEQIHERRATLWKVGYILQNAYGWVREQLCGTMAEKVYGYMYERTGLDRGEFWTLREIHNAMVDIDQEGIQMLCPDFRMVTGDSRAYMDHIMDMSHILGPLENARGWFSYAEDLLTEESLYDFRQLTIRHQTAAFCKAQVKLRTAHETLNHFLDIEAENSQAARDIQEALKLEPSKIPWEQLRDMASMGDLVGWYSCPIQRVITAITRWHSNLQLRSASLKALHQHHLPADTAFITLQFSALIHVYTSSPSASSAPGIDRAFTLSFATAIQRHLESLPSPQDVSDTAVRLIHQAKLAMAVMHAALQHPNTTPQAEMVRRWLPLKRHLRASLRRWVRAVKRLPRAARARIPAAVFAAAGREEWMAAAEAMRETKSIGRGVRGTFLKIAVRYARLVRAEEVMLCVEGRGRWCKGADDTVTRMLGEEFERVVGSVEERLSEVRVDGVRFKDGEYGEGVDDADVESAGERNNEDVEMED